MRRTSAAAAVIIATLVLATPALAATKSYSGSFGGSGKISFKISRNSGTVKLRSLAFSKFPLSCKGGPNTATGAFDPSFAPIQPKYPKLKVVAIHGNSQSPQSTLTLKGRVKAGGGSALGTMRVFGPKVPTDKPAGSTHRCDSGKVHWSASRQ